METTKSFQRYKNVGLGLNRTMQYGNKKDVNDICGLVMFKSYYVVWKPGARGKKNDAEKLFKSYYVVWKLDAPVGRNTSRFGLNRTMQYGNIEKPLALHRIFFRFKSYYVVWKPENENDENNIWGRFKSYYVVWKPISSRYDN